MSARSTDSVPAGPMRRAPSALPSLPRDGQVAELTEALEKLDVRVATDTRANYTPGWKYNHWELKGLPLRMELGPKDMENGVVVLARRDTGEQAMCNGH
jgi:prolyl-tRNA synthetase